jgi:hypothetical protein
MHASQRLLQCMIIVVSLAGCGPTVSAPIRTAATAAPLGSAATPLARATVLPQTVAPTRGGAVATRPNVSPASAVAPTIAPQPTSTPSVMAVALPDGSGGVGFDDLRYDATLGQVLAPGGRTGNVDLVDPSTQAVMPIAGFSAQPRFNGGHDDGPTSADVGHGLTFVTDRTTRRLSVVDPATRAIVASVALASDPDYVRYVAPTGELWVTEPDQEQIEVFVLSDAQKRVPVRAGVITVKGGPESLVIDPQRQRAYTHRWAGATVAIDLNNRTLVAQWPNGCDGSRGIALDMQRGWLFAGCAEGKAFVLDVTHDGRQIASLTVGAGVDVIDYNPTLAHLYLPGATSATMAIVGISASGALSLLGTIATARDAHCVAADTHGTVWVCDPDHGQLLRITDPFPAAGT